MEQNDGQRRRDAADGYAPFEVRPALRRDPEPEPSVSNAVWALAGLGVIALAFALCVVLR